MVALWWLLACGGPEPETVPVGAPPVEQPARTKGKVRKAVPPAPFVVFKPAEMSPERWGRARCNDGTPFAVDIRDQGSDTWVVQLAGGFFCEDERVPCSARKAKLTTTTQAAAGTTRPIKGEGIFSRSPTINPDFSKANHVRLHYCSSDLWLGADTDRSVTTGSEEGWYFSGRHHVRAALELLLDSGLDDATDRVLLVGYSAGGAGVVGNFDQVAELLPRSLEEKRLKVLLDGSWIPPWDTEDMPVANKWGPIHAACEADRRAAGADPLRCIFGPVWWPYIEATGVPVLVQISGMDATQLPAFGIETAEQRSAWQANTKESLDGLPWVFSLGSKYHVVALDSSFQRMGPPKNTFRSVLHAFWEGSPARRVIEGYAGPTVDGARGGR